MKNLLKSLSITFFMLLTILLCGCVETMPDINKYTVAFKDYDGTILREEIIQEGHSATAPKDPIRYGYIFLGWDNEYTNIQKDTILIAQYEKDPTVILEYTVTFIHFDGTLLKAEIVQEGLSATSPIVPYVEGYEFIGWDKGFTNVQENLTITALFKKVNNTVTVTFITNSETIIENQTINKGEKAIEPINPTKKGYTFDGWYLDNEKWSFIGYSVTNDIELQAKWKVNTYNITYELNGATAVNPTTYTVEDEFILNNPTKVGYTFIGWTSEGIQDPQLNVTFKNEIEDKHLIANFTPNKYTITLDANGGLLDIDEIVIEHDQEYNLVLCVPTKEGYTFLGWYDANDNRIFKIEKGTINDITLYGKWERKITEGLEYELSSDKTYYTIVGIGTATDTDIVIPSTYNSLPVKSIAYKAFYNCDNLTSVVIGDNITTIENDAFSLSSDLTSVVIGDNVENIGIQAFELCSNLENVVMGNNVKSIGTQAFYNCPKLTSINIPSSVSNIGKQVFTYCRKLTSINVDINNGFYKSIDGNLYTKDEKTLIHYSTGKTDPTFVIPNGVTNVKQYAFYFSDYLEKIEIPNSVVNIEQYAFLNCNKLEYIDVDENNSVYKSIDGNLYTKDEKTLIQYAIGKKEKSFVIPNSVVNIGSDAFWSCQKLERIEIPNSVTIIEESAFFGCNNLISVLMGDNITIIGNEVFHDCVKLESIEIPNSVTDIGNNAFRNCEKLKNIKIPNSVKSINSYAFASCENLEYIEVDENNTVYKSIDGNLYTKDGETLIQYAIGKKEKSFVIPNSVKKIEKSAFATCLNLTSIEIPNSVTSIGIWAFEYCTSLTSIEIPNSVTSIGYYAFSHCTSLTIYCEATSKPSGWYKDWNSSNCLVVWGYVKE